MPRDRIAQVIAATAFAALVVLAGGPFVIGPVVDGDRYPLAGALCTKWAGLRHGCVAVSRPHAAALGIAVVAFFAAAWLNRACRH